MVDMRTLKVGQKVWMQSGDQFRESTVTETTEKYVAVEPVLVGDERRHIIRFHHDGKQSPAWVNEGLGTWEYFEFIAGGRPCWIQEGPWQRGTKFGPWEIKL